MPVTNLLEQYGSKYKVTYDGSDDPCREELVWSQEIRGLHGLIYPYGHDGSLAVCFNAPTRTKINAWARRLKAEKFPMVQKGDWEVVFKFNPSQIDYIAGLIQVKKRRYLNPEQKAQALEALSKAAKCKVMRRQFYSPVLAPKTAIFRA